MARKTLCVILHYGSEVDTWNCVGTLADDESVDIVISDNDPSQSLVAPPRFSENVRIFPTGGQAGFSEGNNRAIAKFLNENYDSILILNNDTLVEKGALAQMLTTLSLRDVGVVGPCMPFAQEPDRVWACGGRIRKWRLAIDGLQECAKSEFFDVDYLPGAAILCRPDIWKLVKGFSERYFLAYEEAEFALEVRRLGYRSVVDPQARILHYVGMSGQYHRPMYVYNDFRNKIRFAQYLFGNRLGLILGILITLYNVKDRSVRSAVTRFRLWVWSVGDELKAVHSIDLG
jgi:GT2 family glycosyltransferase